MRFLRSSDERDYDKVRKRLQRVSRLQAAAWADSGVWAVQEGLDAYSRNGDRAGLVQARTAVVGLLGAVDHLLDRPS